jgi:predicted alpha/beta superfamily hydrolase
MASPAIWWNDREVLADEATFSKRARSGELHLRILVTSAGDEQVRGNRMIDNASELADRLAALNPGRIQVERVIFPGETHSSSAFASISRALRFAVPQE